MTKVLPNIYHLMAPAFTKAIEESFKELVEHKHLYQNCLIVFPGFDEIYQSILNIPNIEVIQRGLQEECQRIYNSAPGFEWTFRDQVIARRIPFYQANTPERVNVSIEIMPLTIKVFCSNCDGIQPYNFVTGLEISKDFRDNDFGEKPVEIQLFALAYQCQSCKGFPEVFMIRREKMKIVQSGRTPIEKVEIPKYIPKIQKKFFSDAIVAFNSGQILAGKFLLRTFIEQYVRDFTREKSSQNIDEIFEKYSANLPDDFKQRFPSLFKIYGQLSIDIHSADSTSDSFIQAQRDILKHFEAKRLFEIP